MKIFIGSDHAAFDHKAEIIEYLSNRFEVIDLGTLSRESTNYAIYGHKIAEKIQVDEEAFGIAICGSGIGISMAVNRHKGIRGALCRSVDDAKITRLHNNSNVLCLGARNNTVEECHQMIDTFLSTNFEGGRHQQRIELLDE